MTSQKTVLKALSEALPHMDDAERGYFLGYAEAVSAMSGKPAEARKPKRKPRNADRYGLKTEE